MKVFLLVVLMILAGCNPKQNYSVGDCVRVYASTSIGDFYVREVFEHRYIMSHAFKYMNVSSFFLSNEKFIFKFNELDSQNSRKIDCSEVE